MNDPTIARAIELVRSQTPKKWVHAVVLFGSAARDEAHVESDLDLLIVPKAPRLEGLILDFLTGIEEATGVRISPLIAGLPLSQHLELQLLESIARHGQTLVGAMPVIDVHELDLEPVRLLALFLNRLDQRRKTRLERKLFGYESRRCYRGKTYVNRHSGLLAHWGGRRLGKRLVLVPEKAVGELEHLLRSNGARRLLVPAWIQRP